MKCPICGKDFVENSAEGCTCGYSNNLIERIGSMIEYNGQRMTTQASLILAVVIGIFSIANLTSSEQAIPAIFGIRFFVSQIIFLMFWALGLYVIHRFQYTRVYNTTLENILRWPTTFIKEWKMAWEKAKEKEKKDFRFGDYLVKYKDTHIKRAVKKEFEKRKNEKCPTWLKRKSLHIILATGWTYVFYFIFTFLVVLFTYYL